MHDEIESYHAALDQIDQEIAVRLAKAIEEALPYAEGRIWHAHPVWFINGNPVVGYNRLKEGMRLLFWSGQTFEEPLLEPEGKFKAAGIGLDSVISIDEPTLSRWLHKARDIQWDYKNLVKRKGHLERLK